MSRSNRLTQLQSAAPAILPSLLLCDFANLQQEVQRLEKAGAAALHLDVMDGHFVPNLTYGPPLVEAFRRMTTLTLDVHLMISNPEPFVESYVQAGADIVTIHAEAVDDVGQLLERIRSLGAVAGVAINPETPVSTIQPYLSQCDVVLVMSVMPGFGGQTFQPAALEKLRALRAMASREFLLEVDGGVNLTTVGDCAAAGADLLVAGSAIFKTKDYSASVEALKTRAQSRCVARDPVCE